MQDKASLLLVTHVPIRQGPNGPQVDDQTAAGIRQWCRHFDSVTYYGMVSTANGASRSSTAWVDTNKGLIGARARLVALPHAYGISKMARHYVRTHADLRSAIAAHRHLCFTLGGIIGDWPALGALEAIRQKRRFAAWIDRVEPFVIRNKVAHSPVKRLAAETVLPVAQGCIRYLLHKSSVALLQGGDSFEYYARSAPNPHCTYDIHTHAAEEISSDALARKQARVLSGAPLNIIYIGRAAAMKGPFDWLETLERLQGKQVSFRAIWIGDGPDLPAIRERVEKAGLADEVELPGFESRRDVLLEKLRNSDLLLFCHKTPESARCLIEALVCGCPIVGYDTAYPRGLVHERGGGLFAPKNDVTQLVEQIVRLHEDRSSLSQLLARAAKSGKLYNEDMVYKHRAALMLQG